jgi:hypothetical protein
MLGYELKQSKSGNQEKFMNKPDAAVSGVDATKHLLDRIKAIRVEGGDELSEEAFAGILQRTELPAEAGFAFLSYGDRSVTLSVPSQDLKNWYPEKGWILPAKVNIARAIAEKYGLSLYEPPDMSYPPIDKPNAHHHLELSNRHETIIIAHPEFLKVRLFPATDLFDSGVPAYPPFDLGPHLLEDLSALYKV